MKVTIRGPRRKELELQGDWQVKDLLKRLDLNPENFIVIQGQRLLTRDALVKNDESVEILSAISGGA